MTRINFWAEKYRGENFVVNYFYVKISLSWWKQEILFLGDWKYSIQNPSVQARCVCIFGSEQLLIKYLGLNRSEYSTTRFWMGGNFSRKEIESELPRGGNCISKAQATLIPASVFKNIGKKLTKKTLVFFWEVSIFSLKKHIKQTCSLKSVCC